MQRASSPDAHGSSFVTAPLNPLRYDGQSDDPHEVAGKLRVLMPEKARVLDVGCGTGSVTIIANNGKGNEVLAIEPDEQRAAVARSRGVDVFCGFLDESFLAQRGPFDVIMFSDVLEHLPSPDEMLRLAVGGLTPSGLILVSVPNVAHWSVRLQLLFGRFDYSETGILDATHLRWFTQRSIRNLFRKQNLVVLSLQHTAGVDLPVYHSIVFKVLPAPVRRRLVQAMTKAFPTLFACQFVIAARKSF